ncbi:MAG: transaldolase family protein [Candidatus Babeliales bacterium]
MKLFLDTADYKLLEEWASKGIIDGVTTNPTHLAKEGGDPKKVVQNIAELFPQGSISVEVTEVEAQKVYEQARKIADLAENIVVKVPCYPDYYPVIQKLVRENIPLNITLVFTLTQSLCMCKLGVRYISPFIGRLDDIDTSGIDLILQIRAMIDEYGYDTQLLAASIRSVNHLHAVIQAGADVATVPVEVLHKALHHPLTKQGMDKFLADWKKLGITQFP